MKAYNSIVGSIIRGVEQGQCCPILLRTASGELLDVTPILVGPELRRALVRNGRQIAGNCILKLHFECFHEEQYGKFNSGFEPTGYFVFFWILYIPLIYIIKPLLKDRLRSRCLLSHRLVALIFSS